MEITKEQEEQLKAKLGKKEFDEIVNPIKFDSNKIYLIKIDENVYKLHEVSRNVYNFVHLESSNCFSNNVRFVGGLIESELKKYNAQQFDSIQDAIEKGFFKTTPKTLDKYWVVKNDESAGFSEVIDYVNKNIDEGWDTEGLGFEYFGYDGNPSYSGMNAWDDVECFKNNPTVYTVEEFLEITRL